VVEHKAAAVRAIDADHFADEQHVVAGGVPRVMPTLEPGNAAVDQRRTELPGPMRDAVEPVCVRP
jgi:hypothetical protein